MLRSSLKTTFRFSIGVCFIILFGSCNQPEVTLDPTVQLSTLGTAPLSEGTASVVIASNSDTKLYVVATASSGILFQPKDTVNVSENGKIAVFSDVSIRADETRTLRFAYKIDASTLMSGEYPIIFIARSPDPGTNNQDRNEIASSRIKTFIQVVGGYPQFVPDQAAFDQANAEMMWLGNTAYRAQIHLADSDRPKNGSLVLLVPSGLDGYAPSVVVNVDENGGIVFESNGYVEAQGAGNVATVALEPFENQGSRVLIFPFHINPNSFEGTYVIEVSDEWDSKQRVNRLSVGVRVNSTSLGGGDRWLELVDLK